MSAKKKKGNGKGGCPQRGRRYTPAEIEEILATADAQSIPVAAERHGCSDRSISRWRALRAAAGNGTGVAMDGEGDLSSAAEAPASEDPQTAAGHELPAPCVKPAPLRQTPSQDRVRQLVLEAKEEHPTYGGAQVQAHLRRFHGLAVTVKLINAMLVEAGYQLHKRKAKEPEATERFEMVRPNQLWQMDVLQFRIFELPVYLLHILDDYSRFSIGHALLTSVKAQDVIALVSGAMQRYGKPEAMLTDRGPQFSAFRGMTAFEKWLEGNGIDHIKARAYHPQTVGKLEALNSTVREEVIDQREFRTLAEAREHFARWFRQYCTGRPHLALGGLAPADRYFGREMEVRELVARAIAAGGRDLRSDGALIDRPSALDCVVLQLRLVNDALELWFAGKKIRLA